MTNMQSSWLIFFWCHQQPELVVPQSGTQADPSCSLWRNHWEIRKIISSGLCRVSLSFLVDINHCHGPMVWLPYRLSILLRDWIQIWLPWVQPTRSPGLCGFFVSFPSQGIDNDNHRHHRSKTSMSSYPCHPYFFPCQYIKYRIIHLLNHVKPC